MGNLSIAIPALAQAPSSIILLIDKVVVLTQYYVVQENGTKSAAPGESGLFNRIAVLRTERGISRQYLADAVGVNYQTIGFLERGDYGPSLKLAFQIAEYFRLPLEAIFSRQPFQPLSEQVYGKGRPTAAQRPGNDKENSE
jgi:DNA-binding XRE family transcriptional regulator